jgi:hypothetical protein
LGGLPDRAAPAARYTGLTPERLKKFPSVGGISLDTALAQLTTAQTGAFAHFDLILSPVLHRTLAASNCRQPVVLDVWYGCQRPCWRAGPNWSMVASTHRGPLFVGLLDALEKMHASRPHNEKQ